MPIVGDPIAPEGFGGIDLISGIQHIYWEIMQVKTRDRIGTRVNNWSI